MKIYITGHRGYVGRELVRRGFLPLECDVRDLLDVERSVKYKKPDLVIHLAAKSDVNWCEDKENQQIVTATNILGTKNIFKTLDKARIPGIFISTDQIWGGGIFENHKEESKLTPAKNFYSMTKVIGEQIAIGYEGGKVVRTSYLFNRERLDKKIRFVEAGLRQSYPVFIRRSFLHVKDFCDMLEIYCQKFYKLPAILHLSGSKTVSWYKFMLTIEKKYGFKHTISPRFKDVKSFAPRPYFGGLDVSRSFEFDFPKLDYVSGVERIKNES